MAKVSDPSQQGVEFKLLLNGSEGFVETQHGVSDSSGQKVSSLGLAFGTRAQTAFWHGLAFGVMAL